MSAQEPYHIPGTEKLPPTQAPEHPHVEKRAKAAIVIAACAVLVAAIAAAFSGLQWISSDRQADIADRALKLAKQSAQDQASDIERSRKAAENSATAASKLVSVNELMARTMRDQMHVNVAASHLDERAWVSVSDYSAPAEWDGKNKVFIREGQTTVSIGGIVVNSGKTPAHSLRGISTCKNLPTEDKFVPVYPPTDPRFPIGTSFLPPGRPLEIGGALAICETFHRPMTANDINLIKTGKYRLYVYGRITYRDVFEANHWATFCGYVSSNLTRIVSCEVYNDGN